MKKIFIVILVVVTTLAIDSFRGNDHNHQTYAEAPQSTELLKTTNQPSETQTEAVADESDQKKDITEQATCRSAIRQVWPADLQESAIIVMTHENRQENPEAVGSLNPDGVSQDFGCFQINNLYHVAYFFDGDWRDPVWAAQYALRIYLNRQKFEGNGWRAWYAVRGILW